MILNIEKATDHTCLENCSRAKYKIFNLIFLISNRIIFHLDGFQPHHPTVILSIHTETCAQCILFIHYYVKLPIVDIISLFRYFSFLNQTWIFSCEKSAPCSIIASYVSTSFFNQASTLSKVVRKGHFWLLVFRR